MQNECEFYLGMDGGGTKTECVLLKRLSEGTFREIERFQVSGINYNSYTKEQIQEAFIQIAKEVGKILPDIKALTGIGIGAAGISNPNADSFLCACAQNAGFVCKCEICGDDRAALIGAVGMEKGILLISGTGSVCIAADGAGNFFRAGGWGHLIDDAGSAYAIGRDILAAVVREMDRRGCRTSLTKSVMEYLDIADIQQLIAYIYAPETGKKGIAGISKLLEEALEQQDEVAIQIAQNVVKELMEMVMAVDRQMNATLYNEKKTDEQKVPLILRGGVLLNNRWISDLLKKTLAGELPHIFVTLPEHDAAYGAAMLAVHAVKGERT